MHIEWVPRGVRKQVPKGSGGGRYDRSTTFFALLDRFRRNKVPYAPAARSLCGDPECVIGIVDLRYEVLGRARLRRFYVGSASAMCTQREVGGGGAMRVNAARTHNHALSTSRHVRCVMYTVMLSSTVLNTPRFYANRTPPPPTAARGRAYEPSAAAKLRISVQPQHCFDRDIL